MDQTHIQHKQPDLRAIIAAVEASPIRISAPVTLLPPGFDAIDVAVLDWIVARAKMVPHNLRLL